MHKLLFYILILVLLYLFSNTKSEHFQTWNQDYEQLSGSSVGEQMGDYDNSNPYGNNFIGSRGWINPPDGLDYANTIAADLNKPFASPMGSPTSVGNLASFARLGTNVAKWGQMWLNGDKCG